MSGAEYHTALKGQSWKLRLMNTIDECMKYATDQDAFVSLMASEGYQVRWESGRKYITYTTPEGMRCRDNKLHEEKYCKEAMEHEFRIRAELVKRKLRRAEETDGGIEADESAEQRAAAQQPQPIQPIVIQCDLPQAMNKLTEQADGINWELEEIRKALPELRAVHRPDAGAAVSGGDAEIADRDEQTAGTGWEPEREVFLQVDRLAPGFQPAGGPQVDHAGADPWHGGTGGLVWCGGDPRPIPLIPAVAGLTAVGTLMDEDEDAEEKRRRMEAKIAAENFGAALGFAAGAALAVKEKLDEHAAREEQKKQQHEQTMGGLVMKQDWEIYRDTGILGAYRPEQVILRRSEDGGVETLFRDSTAKWEGDDLTRQRAMLVGGKCFLVTSVFPGGASATPTDKLLQLIDTKLEREHHEQ